MDGGLRERQGRGWWDSGGKRELVKSLLRVMRQLTVQLSKGPERGLPQPHLAVPPSRGASFS